MTDLENRPHALYRFFDSSDVLLYVGITATPSTRFRDHGRDKDWWLEVSRITIEAMPNRITALDMERLAIRQERPKYNIAHNGARVFESAEKPNAIACSFVGSFFHGDVNRQWQGIVLESLNEGFYFVETFSWLDGRDYTRHVVHLHDMTGWRFYDSAEAMREQTGNIQALWVRESACLS